MYRRNTLVVIACFVLSACGEGALRDKTHKTPDPPPQQTLPGVVAEGADLFSKYGCFACHALDGSAMYGPPLNDLFMKEVSVVRRGREETILADREYFTRAIIDPEYEKVSDYEHRIMPVPEIPKEDLETLVDYLIGLGEKE
jgi:mono/diheme cytochrome c family protein